MNIICITLVGMLGGLVAGVIVFAIICMGIVLRGLFSKDEW